MRQRSMVGVVTRGRAGLGSFPTPQMNSSGKERRRLVQEEVRAAVEETRTVEAVGMKQQGAWTRWENAVQRKVTWAELWTAEPHHIKFLIQAVYDVLPSPSNLHTWGLAETQHQHAICVPSEEPCNTSSAAAPANLEMDGTAGGMIKFLRPSLSSAKNLCGQSSSDPPRKPSPLSELGSGQHLPEEYVQES